MAQCQELRTCSIEMFTAARPLFTGAKSWVVRKGDIPGEASLRRFLRYPSECVIFESIQ